jgi:hypothetical protein
MIHIVFISLARLPPPHTVQRSNRKAKQILQIEALPYRRDLQLILRNLAFSHHNHIFCLIEQRRSL